MYTATITLISGNNICIPYSPATQAIKPNTPYGANFITISVSLYIASAKLSNTRIAGLPCSPISTNAIPKATAKIMTCNICPFAIAAIGLVGTISTKVSTTDGAALIGSLLITACNVKPAPGFTI